MGNGTHISPACGGDAIQQLRDAIALTGLSDVQFAKRKLDVTDRHLRFLLAGNRPIIGPVRQIVRAILAGAEIPDAEAKPEALE